MKLLLKSSMLFVILLSFVSCSENEVEKGILKDHLQRLDASTLLDLNIRIHDFEFVSFVNTKDSLDEILLTWDTILERKYDSIRELENHYFKLSYYYGDSALTSLKVAMDYQNGTNGKKQNYNSYKKYDAISTIYRTKDRFYINKRKEVRAKQKLIEEQFALNFPYDGMPAYITYSFLKGCQKNLPDTTYYISEFDETYHVRRNNRDYQIYKCTYTAFTPMLNTDKTTTKYFVYGDGKIVRDYK